MMNYLLFVKSTESLSHPTLFERNSAHYNLISHTCFSFSVSNFVFSDNGRRVIIVLNCSSLTFHKCSAPPPPEAVFFSEKKGAKNDYLGRKSMNLGPEYISKLKVCRRDVANNLFRLYSFKICRNSICHIMCE